MLRITLQNRLREAGSSGAFIEGGKLYKYPAEHEISEVQILCGFCVICGLRYEQQPPCTRRILEELIFKLKGYSWFVVETPDDHKIVSRTIGVLSNQGFSVKYQDQVSFIGGLCKTCAARRCRKCKRGPNRRQLQERRLVALATRGFCEVCQPADLLEIRPKVYSSKELKKAAQLTRRVYNA